MSNMYQLFDNYHIFDILFPSFSIIFHPFWTHLPSVGCGALPRRPAARWTVALPAPRQERRRGARRAPRGWRRDVRRRQLGRRVGQGLSMEYPRIIHDESDGSDGESNELIRWWKKIERFGWIHGTLLLWRHKWRFHKEDTTLMI